MYLYLKEFVPTGNGLPEDQESWSKLQCKCRRERKSQFENRQKERILPARRLFFSGLRCLGWVPMGWDGFPRAGEDGRLHSVHRGESHPETSSDTPGITFNQVLGYPVAQSNN